MKKDDTFCLACDGNPNVKCRDGMIDNAGFTLHFVGNMTEKEAFNQGLSTSGSVRAKGEIFHAYRPEPRYWTGQHKIEEKPE